jgi:tartrate/fumarate subfamily iron-sulfur-dependent hydro-lyase alpha chain
MITYSVLEEAMYGAIRNAVTLLPGDVKNALQRALVEETKPLAKQHLAATLKNAQRAASGIGLVCGDTGFPLFFVRVGKGIEIENGFRTVFQAADAATERATEISLLRPTMVDPLTRLNPGTNVGPGMPKVELEFDDESDVLEFVFVPKGGGSEIFGTFYRTLYPSDGEAGILKFVIDSIRESSYAGKVCPPSIVGVGIGGTADLCMKMAKEAAVLRLVGSCHPDARINDMEERLLAAARMLGLGPMGSHGINAILAVHIKTALTHTAGLPVAVNAQCLVGRRHRVVITNEGQTR